MYCFSRVSSIVAGLVVGNVTDKYCAFGWGVSKEVLDDPGYFVLPFAHENM